MMIWHIFRKDLKLLWPLTAWVAAAQIVTAITWLMLGHFGGSQLLAQIWLFLSYGVFVAFAVLTVIAVQQDAIPGDRQDWLVRPIRRRDLMLAKFLFILLAVH